MKKEHVLCLFDLKNPENSIVRKLNQYVSEEQIISELHDLLSEVDEEDTFSAWVLYYLQSRHLTTKDLYDRAFIDRRLFHKIVQSTDYHPSKRTVFALCIAFELSYLESLHLLSLASYAFAPNSRSNRIFRYFITRGIYDVDLINDSLYHFNCPCIGD